MMDLLAGLSVFAAIGAAASSAGTATPLQMKVESTAEQVVIRLVGDSPVACKVSYELEVVGGAGNRSVNRGTATIAASQPVTVATVKLGASTSSPVSAKLSVQGCDGSYSESWPKPA
jgi:hypothetical protein